MGRVTAKNKAADLIWRGDAPLSCCPEEYVEYIAWDVETEKQMDSDEYPLTRALRTGLPTTPVELRIRRFDGTERFIIMSTALLRGPDGLLTGAVGINVDITERKWAEEALRESEKQHAFLLKLSDALRSLSDAVEIENTACRLLGEHLGFNRVYYLEINEAEGYAKVERQYLRGTSPSMAGTYRLKDYGWSLPFLRRGEPVIVSNIYEADGIPQADLAAMETIQQIALISALVSVPLVKNGVLVGALTVSENTPRVWNPEEVELVRETLERTWAAAERARAEEALKKSK